MLKFDIDQQTLNDLHIFPKDKNEFSIFRMFDLTTTKKGSERLSFIFNSPLTDADLIKQRLMTIKTLQKKCGQWNLDNESMDFIEFYLNNASESPNVSFIYRIRKQIKNIFYGQSNDDYIKARGIEKLSNFLDFLRSFFSSLSIADFSGKMYNDCQYVSDVLNSSKFLSIKKSLEVKKEISYSVDHFYRKEALVEIKEILNIVYELDAYIAVSKVSLNYNFCFPKIILKEGLSLRIKGVYHPLIPNSVRNDFDYISNVSFLTGGNMSGKSTYLKSISVSLFLAHLGFPVPADEMEMSIFHGLLTTINLSDNVEHGHSHFYNEVLRVKLVAEKTQTSKRYLIIFDELFKGTNVRDAYDGSSQIISAFSKSRNNIFIVSSHLVEVANNLKEEDNISFIYSETSMINGSPLYTFKIKKGISTENLGMFLINKEKIFDLLANIC